MGNIVCGTCGASWPQAFQFCGKCGGVLPAATGNVVAGPPSIPPPPSGPAPQGPLQPAKIRLVVLRGPGAEGATSDVPIGASVLGQQADLSYPGDPLLAPRHVVLDRSPETLDIVEILGDSGVFRRAREPTLIRSGEVVFAGEQYLLARTAEDIASEPWPAGDEPAETFGTPLPPPRLHVTQLLAGGLPGRVFSTDREVITIGREGADLSFPHDRFMSGRHARIEIGHGGLLQVIDSGSLNGTFVRVQRLPHRLQAGDEILCGSMLFRVEIDRSQSAVNL